MWFIKVCQSKPMALPFNRRPWSWQHPPRVRHGIDNIDESMTEETAQREQNDFQPSYEASGRMGMVVKLKSGFPGKYTTIPSEYELARKLQYDPSPCCIPIRDARIIQNNPPLFMIEMEWAKPLTGQSKKIVGKLYDQYDEGKMLVGEMMERYPRYEKIILDYMDLIRCLEQIKVGSYTMADDAHENNVGYYRDRLVLLDIG